METETDIDNGNTDFTPKKNILVEKITCPNCSESVKIKSRNDLLISNGNDQQQKILNNNEFAKIQCSKCEYNFTFIICLFCNEKILMKIHPEFNQYNGINGFNIKCPYKSCSKFFYFTVCVQCLMANKIDKFIKEGDTIICMNENCKFQYIQVNCPFKLCNEKNIAQRPKVLTNFPQGIIVQHKQEILYQKITCYGCLRPICFASRKGNKNKYYEGQRVMCPYPDCNKIFNRLICPNCSNDNCINEGWYEYGNEIKCSLCKEKFGKILCASCGELSICKDRFFKLGEMICGSENCKQVNNLINCLFCRQLNICENRINLIGRRIKCGYCTQSFAKIICPYCSQINHFPFGDFFFGKIYKCQYFNCLKEFQFLICPKCKIYSTIPINNNNKKEGQKYQCNKCQTIYMNFGCIFCKLNILAKDSNLKIGQLIKCPSPFCNKIFSFMQCFRCQKLIYSNENENIYGKVKQCQNPSCGERTIMTLCPFCKKRVICRGIEDYEENQTVKCRNCNTNYTFHRSDNLYTGNLQILEELEGKPFIFGKSEIDENYIIKEELFFTKNDFKEINGGDNGLIKISTNFGECIVCHNRKKESVFFPCGHRCTCYICANLIFASEKKCPKCKKETICIIRKVYE
jgi:protein neuralized